MSNATGRTRAEVNRDNALGQYRCKRCKHYWAKTLNAGTCNCPMPVWSWDAADSLTRNVHAECPAGTCPLFQPVKSWERRNTLRLKTVNSSEKIMVTKLFDHTQYEPNYDPHAHEYESKFYDRWVPRARLILKRP